MHITPDARLVFIDYLKLVFALMADRKIDPKQALGTIHSNGDIEQKPGGEQSNPTGLEQSIFSGESTPKEAPPNNPGTIHGTIHFQWGMRFGTCVFSKVIYYLVEVFSKSAFMGTHSPLKTDCSMDCSWIVRWCLFRGAFPIENGLFQAFSVGLFSGRARCAIHSGNGLFGGSVLDCSAGVCCRPLGSSIVC
jgi:hypothetical protein